jgi:NhaA family Na+:H+ antiporter
VIAGLVLGKITASEGSPTWRAACGGAPCQRTRQREIAGVAALGGVGFTVSLFITDLAFTDAALISQAKVGILTASAVAALAGAVLLLTAPAGTGATRRRRANEDRGAQ